MPEPQGHDAISHETSFSFSEPDDAQWHQQPGEKGSWYSRFLIFRNLGPTRKLLQAVHTEQATAHRKGKTAQKSPKKPTSSVPGSWKSAFEQWNWKARAQAWDEWEQQRLEAQRQAYIDGIMQQGYALKHERVKALQEMFDELNAYRKEPHKMWLVDGRGGIQFNDAVFREGRAALADIAAEMGERVKQVKQDSTVNIDIAGAKDSLFNKIAAFARKSDGSAES